jgi:mannosyltransferase
MNKAKGVDVFIKAIPKIIASVPNTRFRIIGPDEGDAPGCDTYRDYARLICGSKFVDNRVTFMGWLPREELPRHYRESMVVVIPSVGPESFGYSVVEAMSCGAAVVASRVGAIPEIIDDESIGKLFPPGENEALAECAIKLLLQPEQAAKMGQQARKVVEIRYAKHIVAKEMTDLYSSFLQRSGYEL